jgi:hypothetical protein
MNQQPKQDNQENFQEKVNEIMSNLEVDPENAINSLSDKNARLGKENAQKDAVINALIKQLIELEKDNKNLREAIQKNERGDKEQNKANKPNAK